MHAVVHVAMRLVTSAVDFPDEPYHSAIVQSQRAHLQPIAPEVHREVDRPGEPFSFSLRFMYAVTLTKLSPRPHFKSTL